MKLVMIPLTQREMLRAARWYDRRGKGLGDRLLDDIRASIVAILEFSAAQPAIDAVYRRKILDAFPYTLIYRNDGDTITIVAVANFKRRPGYWRKRVGKAMPE
jgi:toxin ParE1/3/4